MRATRTNNTDGQRERAFLTAEWRFLAILNYEVDPLVLTKHVPPGTELDLFNGKALVSIVGFRFLSTKVFGLPIPLHRNFDEVNLRFYVRRRDSEGTKRGVTFVQEIVPRRLVASTARLFYGENYRTLPMEHQIELHQDGENMQLSLQYAWRLSSNWFRIIASASGKPTEGAAGSEEQFVTEHYWGYSKRRSRDCLEYRVAHAPWRVLKAPNAQLDGYPEKLFGRDFGRVLSQKPCSAFVSEGSGVTVYTGNPC